MQFQPKTEKQIQEERVAPEGEYDFEVMAAEEKLSKNGNNMIEVVLNVYRADGSKFALTDFLLATDKMAWKLRHFCESCGILDLYEKGELQAFHCRGLAGRAKLIQQDSTDYGLQNRVKDYVGTGAERKEVPVTEDECPF